MQAQMLLLHLPETSGHGDRHYVSLMHLDSAFPDYGIVPTSDFQDDEDVERGSK